MRHLVHQVQTNKIKKHFKKQKLNKMHKHQVRKVRECGNLLPFDLLSVLCISVQICFDRNDNIATNYSK